MDLDKLKADAESIFEAGSLSSRSRIEVARDVIEWYDAKLRLEAEKAQQPQAPALAERERMRSIILRAPYEQPKCDGDSGEVEMALKAMAFDLLAKLDGRDFRREHADHG